MKDSTVERAMLTKATEIKHRCVKSCNWTASFSTVDLFDKLFDDLARMTTNPRSKLEFDVSHSSFIFILIYD